MKMPTMKRKGWGLEGTIFLVLSWTFLSFVNVLHYLALPKVQGVEGLWSAKTFYLALLLISMWGVAHNVARIAQGKYRRDDAAEG